MACRELVENTLKYMSIIKWFFELSGFVKSHTIIWFSSKLIGFTGFGQLDQGYPESKSNTLYLGGKRKEKEKEKQITWL